MIKSFYWQEKNQHEKEKVYKGKNPYVFFSCINRGKFNKNHLRNEAKRPNETNYGSHFVHLMVTDTFYCVKFENEHVVNFVFKEDFHNDSCKED